MAKKKDPRHIMKLIKETAPEVILRAAALCDGHSILKPDAFFEVGLHPDVVQYVTSTHRSDGTPKGTIFVQGEPVSELTAVYGLDLLVLIARGLDVKFRHCMGRGFQAQAIQHALRQHFSQPPASSSA
jgi:hypothetical protein